MTSNPSRLAGALALGFINRKDLTMIWLLLAAAYVVGALIGAWAMALAAPGIWRRVSDAVAGSTQWSPK